MMKSRLMSTQVCAISVILIAVSTFLVSYLKIDPRRLLLPNRSSTETETSSLLLSPSVNTTTTATTTTTTNLNNNSLLPPVQVDQKSQDDNDTTISSTSANETSISQSQSQSQSSNYSPISSDVEDDDDNDPSEDDHRYTEFVSGLDNDADTADTDPNEGTITHTDTDTDPDTDIPDSISTTTDANNVTSPLTITNLSLSARSLQKRCNDALRRFYLHSEQFTLQPVPPSTPSVLSNYISWHVHERACLLSNETHCDGSLPRVLVWRCFTILCGGVGDRMRGIRFLFLIAVVTRRLFFIDWPQRAASPYPLTTAVLPHTVDWRLPTKALRRIAKRPGVFNVSLVSGKTKKGARPRASLRKDTGKVFIVPNETDFENLWREEHIIYLTNRMARSSLHYLCDNPTASMLQPLSRQYIPLVGLERIIMHLLFTPSPLIETLTRHRASFGDDNDGDHTVRYIAAHARTGVDVGEGKGPRLGYIATHLEQAAKRLFQCAKDIIVKNNSDDDDDKLNIFLASDSHTLKEHFIALAMKENVTVLTEDRRPLHIDREATARKVNHDDGHNVCLAFLDVFADVFALAKAEAFVYYHSGFAATAESFGRHAHTHELEGDHEGTEGECVPTEEDLRKGEKMRRPFE